MAAEQLQLAEGCTVHKRTFELKVPIGAAPGQLDFGTLNSIIKDVALAFLETVLFHRSTGEVSPIDAEALGPGPGPSPDEPYVVYPRCDYSDCDYDYHTEVEEKAIHFADLYVDTCREQLSFLNRGFGVLKIKFFNMEKISTWGGFSSKLVKSFWETWEFRFKLVNNSDIGQEEAWKGVANSLKRCLYDMGKKICGSPCEPQNAPPNHQASNDYVDMGIDTKPYRHEIVFGTDDGDR